MVAEMVENEEGLAIIDANQRDVQQQVEEKLIELKREKARLKI